jgi:hypothetical protein
LQLQTSHQWVRRRYKENHREVDIFYDETQGILNDAKDIVSLIE